MRLSGGGGCYWVHNNKKTRKIKYILRKETEYLVKYKHVDELFRVLAEAVNRMKYVSSRVQYKRKTIRNDIQKMMKNLLLVETMKFTNSIIVYLNLFSFLM